MRSTCASRDRHSGSQRVEHGPGEHSPGRSLASVLCMVLCLALPGCSGCDDPRVDEVAQEPESQSSNEAETTAADSTEASSKTARGGEPADGEPPESGAPNEAGGAASNGAMARGVAGEGGGSSSGSSGAAGPSTAAEALRSAEALRTQAQQAARGGDPGDAFLKASRAWQLVSRFPESAACAAMSAELSGELEALGAQSNEHFGAGDESVPLIDR